MNDLPARTGTGRSPDPFVAGTPLAQYARGADGAARFHLVDLTGCDAGLIARMLPMAQKVLAERGLVPVFVTDGLDLMTFRREKVLFEVLPHPALSPLARPDLDWRAYRATRLARIRIKWRPVGETRLSGEGGGAAPTLSPRPDGPTPGVGP